MPNKYQRQPIMISHPEALHSAAFPTAVFTTDGTTAAAPAGGGEVADLIYASGEYGDAFELAPAANGNAAAIHILKPCLLALNAILVRDVDASAGYVGIHQSPYNAGSAYQSGSKLYQIYHQPLLGTQKTVQINGLLGGAPGTAYYLVCDTTSAGFTTVESLISITQILPA